MIFPQLAAIKETLGRLLWPEICLHCREDLPPKRTLLCDGCSPGLKPVPSPFCPHCQDPRPTPHHLKTCLGAPGACRLIRAAFLYNGPAVSLVHAFKYRGRRRAAAWAGTQMAAALPSLAELGCFDAVVPVPLHPRRLRERGYNQAGILAHEISAASGRPVMELLRRARATSKQWGLKRKDRLENVAGAFQALPEAQGLRLLLIDDVCTTGASLDECARALMQAGALSARGYAFAREAL